VGFDEDDAAGYDEGVFAEVDGFAAGEPFGTGGIGGIRSRS
jgi:hypothetical protein